MKSFDYAAGHVVGITLFLMAAFMLCLPFIHGCVSQQEAVPVPEAAPCCPAKPKVETPPIMNKGQIWLFRSEDPFMEPIYIHILDMQGDYCLFEWVDVENTRCFGRGSNRIDYIREYWMLIALSLEELLGQEAQP